MKRLFGLGVAFVCAAFAFTACSKDQTASGSSGAEAGTGGVPAEDFPATRAGAAAVPDATSGGAESQPGDEPGDFQVEFEELALEGEPAFVTDFAFYPGDDRDFLALDKSGRLMRYRLDSQRATLISETQLEGVHDELDCGAISLAFEPDFAEGRYLYVAACVSDTHSDIIRVDVDDALEVVPGSEVSVLSVGSRSAKRPWHNVGSIGFEPGGVMWALFGDKSLGAPAGDLKSPLGKLLRIVPFRDPGLGGFEPASDGPLALDPEADPSVYALGLRSPFRGTLDSQGRYWIADVGSDEFEEVNVARAPLQDFGWPEREGPCSDCEQTTPPTFSWEHGSAPDYVADDEEVETTIGRVAWVGPEVRPHEPDRYDGQLAGSVLFGDYCAGFVRHARVDDEGTPTVDAHLGHLNNASSFRQHSDGYVYAMTFGRCQTDVKNQADEGQSRLYRMVSKD